VSAREQAENLLSDAEQLGGRPELQTARASVAQGYAILALADAVEAHTQQLIASTEFVADAVQRGR
jgi:hypothetical protein